MRRKRFNVRYSKLEVPTAKNKSDWHEAIKVRLFSEKAGGRQVDKGQVLEPQLQFKSKKGNLHIRATHQIFETYTHLQGHQHLQQSHTYFFLF